MLMLFEAMKAASEVSLHQLSFWKNRLVSKLEAATWILNSVFASFCFKGIQFIFDDCCSLGSFMITGEELG